LVQAILKNPDKWIILNAGKTGKEHLLHRNTFPASTVDLPELQPAFHSL
jgi:hypothetical protein